MTGPAGAGPELQDGPGIGAVPAVTAGLFFDPPPPLPRGRHTLPRETIARAQRERLLIAVTELLAARGYAAVSIADVVQRAQVSRAVFYQCFDDKSACASAAYDRFIEVLLANLAANLDERQSLPEFVDAALYAYLDPMQRDPVVGRAFQVEIDAMGAPARTRRRTSLALFADVLLEQHQRLADLGAAPQIQPRSAYLGAVYAVRQLTSDAIEAGDADQLIASIPELSHWLLRILE